MNSFKKKLKIAQWTQPTIIKNDIGCNGVKSWCSKWDRMMAAITAVILFSALLAIVIYNIKCDDDSWNKSTFLEYNQSPMKLFPSESGSQCLMKENENMVECKNFPGDRIERLAEEINRVATQDNIKLTLDGVDFVEGEIEKGWLKNVQKAIVEIYIKNSNLKNIGERSFTDRPFENLKYLSFIETEIEVLRRESFLDTNNINTFEFTLNSFRPIVAEEKVFEGMANTLVTLQFMQCLNNPETLENITGTNAVPLPRLQMLDLRLNNLEMITEGSFTNVRYLETIHLSNNVLNRIENSSFSLPRLTNLNIAFNFLTTLPEGLFNSMQSGSIFIGGNQFNCNCDLVWFRDFYIAKEAILFKNIPFECYQNYQYVNYTEVDFCPDTTTTTSQVTASSSSITTTTEPPTTPSTTTTIESSSHITTVTEPPITLNTTVTSPTTSNIETTTSNYHLVAIICDSPKTEEVPGERIYSQTVAIRERSVTFTFYQIDDQAVYEIQVFGDVSRDRLIWINSQNKSDYGCLLQITEQTIIGTLKHENTYTICLLPENETGVSPYDCTGLTVPPVWGSRTWLPNHSMSLVISAVCGSLLTAILLSSLIMFYCIRQHPNLIKGNKRLIIVKSKAADAIVMPKNYDQNYTPPSLNSCSDGYLTPKNKSYGQVLRTISERSVSSACLTNGRMRRSHIKRRVKLEQVATAFDDHVYEPPPLPPNHPCEWRSKMYSNV